MSEPLAESLSRFTPDATGLDRDALLFAAGRASARPSRRWQSLAGVLAASQLLTLILLWPSTPPSTPPVIIALPDSATVPDEPTAEYEPSSWGVLRTRLLTTEDDWSETAVDEPMAPPEPPLRAFGTPLETILN